MKKILKIIAIFLFVAVVIYAAGCAEKKTTGNETQGASEKVTPAVTSENVTENKTQGASEQVTPAVTATTSAETHAVTPALTSENVTENNTAKVDATNFSELRNRDLEVANMTRSNSS